MGGRERAGLSLAGALAVAGCAFLVIFLVGQGLARAGIWAGILGLPVAVTGGIPGVRAMLPRRPAAAPSWADVPEWVVERPEQVDRVVAGLLHSKAAAVGITTGLRGAGGFGKTTLALMVCADPRVRRRFRGGVYLVQMGSEVRGPAAVTTKVNDLIGAISGEKGAFTDPEPAGTRLGVLLDTGRRRLLVLDDVWTEEQLKPFVSGARRCARLVTTRVPGLLPDSDSAVLVDQMSPEQARRLLLAKVQGLDVQIADRLLAETGRWPLLLRLVNKILVNAAESGPGADAAGRELLTRLQAAGPAAVDELLPDGALDVHEDKARERAVRATIAVSTDQLHPGDARRFAELGVFAEDETVPADLIARLWQVTGGLTPLEASRLCRRLADLALITLTGAEPPSVTIHDVVRDFLRAELGPELAKLASHLLDAAAAGLPPGEDAQLLPPWWQLGPDDRYLRDHLIEHLEEAERSGEAAALAGDLRWVGARVRDFGSADAAADLARIGTPGAARLQAVLTRTAHLLGRTQPADAVVDVLHSRVAADPEWGPQAARLRDSNRRPRLVNRCPPPDLPDTVLQRVLFTGYVKELELAPDGRWLAGVGYDTIRTWDTASWTERPVLSVPGLRAVGVAPDGSWLAAAGAGPAVRVWDPVTGRELTELDGHRGSYSVDAVQSSPDGSWLISAGNDRSVRIWDTATWQQRAVLAVPGRNVRVQMAPDGRWLASVDRRGSVRIWDTATWRERKTFAVGRCWNRQLQVAPDGSWLAVATEDGAILVWDTVAWTKRAVLLGDQDSRIAVMKAAPDGSWLAVRSNRGSLRIWDPATWDQRAIFPGYPGVGTLEVAANSRWLAVGHGDGTVRAWHASTGNTITIRDAASRGLFDLRPAGAPGLASAPDGSWLALAVRHHDGRGGVQIHDAITGQRRAVLAGHGGDIMATAPDGRWLATTGAEEIRIWDTTAWRHPTGPASRERSVTAVRATPDGGRLVVAESNDNDDYEGLTTIVVRDSVSGQATKVAGTIRGRVRSIDVAPDGSRVCVTDAHGTRTSWDTASWHERKHQKGPGRWYTPGHQVREAHGAVRLRDNTTGRLRVFRTRRAPGGALSRIGWLLTWPLRAPIRRGGDSLLRGSWRWWGHGRWATPTAAPDDSWLVITSHRRWWRTARLWDAAAGRPRAVLARRARQIDVTPAPDSSWLAVAADGVVRIWDPATAQVRAALVGSAVTVAPDGSWLAAGDRDGSATIWIPATGEQRAVAGPCMVASLVVSPCGQLAAEHDDRVIVVWDIATWQPLAFMRVDDTVYALAWLGRTGLAVGGRAGLYLFDLLC